MSDMRQTENSLITTINEEIAKMKEATRLGTDKEISFIELEAALKGYSFTYTTLLSMYNISRIDLQAEKESFESWYSEVYTNIRSEVNKPELTAQKWASTKEIEHMIRTLHKEEYLNRKNDLMDKEIRVDFMHGLIEVWKSHQFILATLSSNVRKEVDIATS